MRTCALAISIVTVFCVGFSGGEAEAATVDVVTIRCAPEDSVTCFLVNWAPATSVGVYKGRFVNHTITPEAITLPDPDDEIASGIFMSYEGGEQGLGWLDQQVIIKPDGLTVLVNLADGATAYTSMSDWLVAGGGHLE